MHTDAMRRIQIYIEEKLDDALKAEAARGGRSKAAIICECVSARLLNQKPTGLDSLTALAGTMDVEPANIDEVIYGE